MRKGDISGRIGATTLIHRTQGTAAARWLLVGCGKHADFNARRLTSALTAAIAGLRNSGTKEAISYLAYGVGGGLNAGDAARHSVEAARASVYRFDELKSRTDPSPRLTRLGLAAPRGTNVVPLRAAIKVGTAIANGSDLARDLGNRPPNVCTPSHLAEVIAQMKTQKIKAIIVEPYHDRKIAERVASATGAKVVDFAQYPGALPDTDTYIKLIDALVSRLAAALK